MPTFQGVLSQPARLMTRIMLAVEVVPLGHAVLRGIHARTLAEMGRTTFTHTHPVETLVQPRLLEFHTTAQGLEIKLVAEAQMLEAPVVWLLAQARQQAGNADLQHVIIPLHSAVGVVEVQDVLTGTALQFVLDAQQTTMPQRAEPVAISAEVPRMMSSPTNTTFG